MLRLFDVGKKAIEKGVVEINNKYTDEALESITSVGGDDSKIAQKREDYKALEEKIKKNQQETLSLNDLQR